MKMGCMILNNWILGTAKYNQRTMVLSMSVGYDFPIEVDADIRGDIFGFYESIFDCIEGRDYTLMVT